MEEEKVVLWPHLMKVSKFLRFLKFLTNSTVKQCHSNIRINVQLVQKGYAPKGP